MITLDLHKTISGMFPLSFIMSSSIAMFSSNNEIKLRLIIINTHDQQTVYVSYFLLFALHSREKSFNTDRYS